MTSILAPFKLNLDHIPDTWGYYIANGQKNYSKLAAIKSLPKNNYDLKWYFWDKEFSQFNWFKNPDVTLEQAYALRAQQLRDTYDHLVLCYSGGSDSHQILHSFVNNNILLDEIHFHGSFKMDKTRLPISRHPSFKNVEIYHVAEPKIKELQKKWPNLKVDFYDWTDNMVNYYRENQSGDWLLAGNAMSTPNRGGRAHIHRSLRQTLDLSYNKKKVAYIWGQDKPRITKVDDKWYMYFIDTVLNEHTCAPSNETDELFFWSPYSEHLLVKQAHVLKAYFESDPMRMQFLEKMTVQHLRSDRWYEVIKPVIYPKSWDTSTYQTDKVSGLITERDWWFYDQDRSADVWNDSLTEIRNLDPYWRTGKFGLYIKGSLSKMYQFA